MCNTFVPEYSVESTYSWRSQDMNISSVTAIYTGPENIATCNKTDYLLYCELSVHTEFGNKIVLLLSVWIYSSFWYNK